MKKGEVLKDYGKDFKYEIENLAGAVFAIYAAEDIYTADFQKDDAGNRILEYAKDALVTELTTDETGSATIKNLPLGNYKVVEKQRRMVLYIMEQSRMCSLSMWIRILLPWWKA